MINQNTAYLRSIEILKTKVLLAEYPFNIPAIQKINTIDFHPNITFLIGENGVGKSTILEAIAINLGFNAEGGNQNVNFRTEHTSSILHKHLKLVRSHKRPQEGYFLRAESFYNVASYMDSIASPSAQGYGGKSLHHQSHGESFLSVLKHKFHGNGLYLLDEPEAALSPTRQMSVLAIIDQLIKKNSQFIIATHSPILLSYPNAKIYQICDSGVQEVKYTETEHYTITRNFLNYHNNMLERILPLSRGL